MKRPSKYEDETVFNCTISYTGSKFRLRGTLYHNNSEHTIMALGEEVAGGAKLILHYVTLDMRIGTPAQVIYTNTFDHVTDCVTYLRKLTIGEVKEMIDKANSNK